MASCSSGTARAGEEGPFLAGDDRKRYFQEMPNRVRRMKGKMKLAGGGKTCTVWEEKKRPPVYIGSSCGAGAPSDPRKQGCFGKGGGDSPGTRSRLSSGKGKTRMKSRLSSDRNSKKNHGQKEPCARPEGMGGTRLASESKRKERHKGKTRRR